MHNPEEFFSPNHFLFTAKLSPEQQFFSDQQLAFLSDICLCDIPRSIPVPDCFRDAVHQLYIHVFNNESNSFRSNLDAEDSIEMTALITSIQQFIGKHHSRNLVRNLYQFQAFNPVEGVSNTLHILTYQMFYHESGLLPKDYRIGLDTHLQNPTPPTRSNYIHLAYAPIAQYSVH